MARALSLFVKLMRASRSVMAATEGTMVVEGLTAVQFAVLEALLHKGGLSHGELRAKVLTSPGNLTDVIDKLEGRGLVLRRRESGDARRVCVELTQTGAALIERAFPAHAARIAEVMGRLTDREQEEMARLLRKLGVETESSEAR